MKNENSMKGRVLAILLTLCMAFAFMPTAMAEGATVVVTRRRTN